MERERIDRDSMYVTCGAGWILKDIELCHWHLGDPLRHGIPPRSRIAMIEVTFYENSQIWNLFTWDWLFREDMPFTNGCILAFIISIIFHYYCGSSPMWQQWWEGAQFLKWPQLYLCCHWRLNKSGGKYRVQKIIPSILTGCVVSSHEPL